MDENPQPVPDWYRGLVLLLVLLGVAGLIVLEHLAEPHMSPATRTWLRAFHIIPRTPYYSWSSPHGATIDLFAFVVLLAAFWKAWRRMR
jgi:hypothetical protein